MNQTQELQAKLANLCHLHRCMLRYNLEGNSKTQAAADICPVAWAALSQEYREAVELLRGTEFCQEQYHPDARERRWNMQEFGRKPVKVIYTSEYRPYEPGDVIMCTSPRSPLDPDTEYTVTEFKPPRFIHDDQAGIIFVEGREQGCSAEYVTLVRGKL